MAKDTKDLSSNISDDIDAVLSERDKLDQCIKSHFKDKLKAAVFTHAVPDPDAIASLMLMRFILENFYNIDTDCFISGGVSHPQNKVAVQLLDPDLSEASTYKADQYCLNILVDTIPSHAGTDDKVVDFHIVIDHHKVLPDDSFAGLCIHHHSGSCAGILTELLGNYNSRLDDENEEHVKLASAVMAAVQTDTDFCTRPDTTTRDFKAQQFMFNVSDISIVRKIVRFNWPMSWVKLMGTAINDHEIKSGVAVVGLGQLKVDQYDAVAAVADFMLGWGSVHTACAFALFDGHYISCSIRSSDATIEVHSLCQMLGGESGEGGGKSGSGRYIKPLGAFSFDLEDSEEVILQWWELTKQREMDKIFKAITK